MTTTSCKFARTYLARMAEVLGQSRQVVIVPHDNPDPDALASAFGLRHLIGQYFGKRARIVYSGDVGCAENRAMVRLLRLPLEKSEDFRVMARVRIALVDCQPGGGNATLARSAKPTIVIDHHRGRRRLSGVLHADVRPHYGATGTIITEYLQAARVQIPPRVATALFFGIQTDTLGLSRHATPADFEAYRDLFPLVNHRVLTRIEHLELPASFFQVAHTAIERAVVRGNLVFSNLGEVPVSENVPQMADYLAQLEGTKWAAVIGRVNGEMRLSLRGTRAVRDAGSVLKRIVGRRGSAGGHGRAAGGRIPLRGMGVEQVGELERMLEERFIELLAPRPVPSVPLREM